MRTKPYTTKEFFDVLVERVKELGLMPKNLVDYALGSGERKIISDEIEVFFSLEFGSSEGMYMTVYVNGDCLDYAEHPMEKIGTVKTLNTDIYSARQMSILGADLKFTARDLVRDNEDDFIFKGCQIYVFLDKEGADIRANFHYDKIAGEKVIEILKEHEEMALKRDCKIKKFLIRNNVSKKEVEVMVPVSDTLCLW